MLLLVAGCQSGGGPAEPEPPSLPPGDHTFTLEIDDRTRSYLVRIPPGQPGSIGHPVLMAFHGGGGNPDQFKRSAGLDAVADREGLVVAYPAGTGQLEGVLTWNGGPGCCGYARDREMDDVGFALAVVADLERRHSVDPTKIFVTGHSNGSMMALRIAAEAPESIAGAVGVAGTLQIPSIQPGGSVPILHIHSEDDPRAFYFGGTREDRVHPPVPEMLDVWAEANRCGPDPVEVDYKAGASGSRDAGHTATLYRWMCDGAPLEHWRLTGVGHPWPGDHVNPARELIVGPGTELLSAPDEIWKFLAGLL